MTAPTRLSTATQKSLSHIEKSACGFDLIRIWFDDPFPDLPLSRISPLCSSVNLTTAISREYQLFWKSKLEIVAPTHKVLVLLSEAVGTRYRTKLTHVEIALDWITRTFEGADELQRFLLAHLFVDQQRFRTPIVLCEETSYNNSSSGQGVVIYVGGSKQVRGHLCCHLEFRFEGLSALSKAGLLTVHDLALFDHRKFWNDHLQLRDFRSLEELGRIVTPSSDLSVPALYKHANKFIDTHGHEGARVLHNCVRASPAISKILVPVDHRHFLPEKYAAKAPEVIAPVVSKFTVASATRQTKKIKLTDEQLAVINSSHQRLIVEAVAGSGKTTTLDYFARRILCEGVRPEEILALSFSRRSVGVMRERLGEGIEIRTFHAFARSLLPAGITYASDSSAVLQDAMKKVRTGLKWQRVRKFFMQPIEAWSRIVEQAEFVDFAPKLEQLKALKIAYDHELEARGEVDFSGMISRGREMLDRLRLRYKYVIVDEFQDLDTHQFQFLHAIAKQVPNIALFGDSWQSIFGFAGTVVQNPAAELGAVTMTLSKSQRVTQETAALASAIVGGKIVGSGNGPRPLLTKCDTHDQMVMSMVQQVQKLLSSGVPARDIAILTRTNAQQRPFDRALIETGIHTNPSYLESRFEHVEKMLDLLAEMTRRTNREASSRDHRKMAAYLRAAAGRHFSPDRQKLCRRIFWGGVRTLSFAGKYAAAMRLHLHLQDASLDDKKLIAFELNRWAAVAAGFRTVKRLRLFLHELRAQPPVVLSTIHGVKGDEFDHVLLSGVVDGNLPFHRGDVDEERRLFYVAVTRARERAFLFEGPCFQVGINTPGKTLDASSPFLTADVLSTLKIVQRGASE